MMEVYYLTVLEAGSPGSRFLAGLVSGEGLLHGLQTAACSLCPHRVAGVDGWEGCGGLEQGDRKEERGERERKKKRKTSSSYEDTNPIGSWPHPYDLI